VRPPLDEYQSRKSAREITAAQRERSHVHLGNAKVAVFVAVVIYAAVKLGDDPSSMVFGIAVALFVALSIWHELVMRALARARAAVEYYVAGLARIEDRWMRDEPSGERFRDGDHPYADDLDVFGPRSLFQLLSTCRTPIGEARLASWLLQPSPVAEIRDRQARVAALRDRLDLRERIAVVNAGRRRVIDSQRLIEWAERPRELPRVRLVIVFLTLVFAGALFSYLNGGSGSLVVGSLIVNLVVLAWLIRRASAIVETLESSAQSAALDLLANVIREIDSETFESPAVRALAERLGGASRALGKLARMSDWTDSRHNVFVRLSEIPLLFTLHLAYAAEAWRTHHGNALREWVDAAGEMEALLSVAGYAYEHPADVFAEIVEHTEPFFDAIDVAHPLLPARSAVANTIALGNEAPDDGASHPRVLIVSGSNMAGKSTLMRTVGVNAVLAMAGAPVRARTLRLSPLTIGTCLRHSDSLQEHRSGFYTEALRIRSICNRLDGPLPLLFLFDELLSGTNSKDRRIAAEGIVRMMLGRRSIGMITTHDLSLTEIAGIFPGRVRNVHLQDHVENGTMVFDYKLRDGVITHSNALELMRMIGLDV